MSDLAPPDATLDVLRQREAELDLEVRVSTGRRDELRALISRLAPPRSRVVRKPRATEPEGGPVPLAIALEGALASLGTAVRAHDAELEQAA